MKYSILFIGIAIIMFSSCKETTGIDNSDVIDRITHSSIILSDANIIPFERNNLKQVFYLIRHAEKDTINKENPPLSAKGELRAEALDHLFKQARLDEIYTTLYIRTMMTPQKVSDSKGMALKPYDASELKAFAERLKNDEGLSAALIVGHSNTTPQLAAFLSDKSIDDVKTITESEYEDIYIVSRMTDGSSTLNNYRYFVENE